MVDHLLDLDALIVDCQATGSDPRNAHLLEIGWAVARAGRAGARAAEAHLIRLPEGATVPRPVLRLTGIALDQLTAGTHAAEAYRQLLEAAERLADAAGRERIPTIIHYARYESAFLEHLQATHAAGRRFPFDIVCTHEISRRLLPDLPRKGLRAVAGFLGHSVSPLKRCRDHITATAAIWRQVVRRLVRDEGIRTLAELKAWLQRTDPPLSSARCYPMSREARLGAPDQPGVYRLLRSNGDLLYIGKARSLKRRVNSYFQQRRRHSERVLEMLSQAVDLAVTPTASALEAALLESEQIKRLHPPYNKALQESGRRLIFCSRDFRAAAPTPGKNHPIGPLPGHEAFAAVHDIGRRLQNDGLPWPDDAPAAAAFLGISGSHAPESGCCRDGIRIFRDKYRCDSTRGTLWTLLMRIGTVHWRENRSNGDREPEADPVLEALPEGEAAAPFAWTPETVASGIEALLGRCAHAIRRARWFCLLSEAALDWRDASGAGKRRHVVVIKAGRLWQCRQSAGNRLPPPPPGCHVSLRSRQRQFDLQAYDRLRVLTTELRRLTAENRDVRIRLSRTAGLNQKQVQRLLYWL